MASVVSPIMLTIASHCHNIDSEHVWYSTGRNDSVLLATMHSDHCNDWTVGGSAGAQKTICC